MSQPQEGSKTLGNGSKGSKTYSTECKRMGNPIQGGSLDGITVWE